MSELGLPRHRLSESEEADVAQYRPFCGLAACGLIAGLLSIVAFFTPVLWAVPVAGLVLSGLALRRIARSEPAMTGRWAAATGLVLSAFFAAAAPADLVTYRARIDAEARVFAAEWIAHLLDNAPQKALELTRQPAARKPLDDTLWETYADGTGAREELEGYVEKPEVKAILDLSPAVARQRRLPDPKAVVRHFATERQGVQKGRDAAVLVFAVTYEDAGRKKTFFTRMAVERFTLTQTGMADWQVVSTEGGIRPMSLGGN